MPTPTVNLTTQGSNGSINDAVFQTGQTQAAGTGTFDSFIQIQHNGTEQGYNSDHSPQFDEKNSAPHNHSVLLASVPIVIGDGSNGTQEGVAYREFLLDINESNRYLSLDALQIWQEESGNLNNFTPGSGFAGSHTNYLAYNLDAGGDHWVAMNDGLSHGSGQSDVRILIPDSVFINDAAHRYITLYSKFGVQSGSGSDGGFEEWGLHGPSGGSVSALAVSKTATISGDNLVADHVGEVITYSMHLDNTGNTSQTSIVVTDPFVSDLTRAVDVVGNNDNILNPGEVWSYTAHHTVTQADLDNGGDGSGFLVNTFSARSAQVTTPVSATAVTQVVSSPVLEMTKTADVSSVDAAGDEINYSITVTNIGTTTLTGLIVTDPQFTLTTPIINFDDQVLGPDPITVPILNGEFNAGDTNQNGVEDPGETFQFTFAGDENSNGVVDPGETVQFANIGDTNHNGQEDPGEVFEFHNAGDTNHNGVEDDGETFQFIVSHELAGVDADHDGFNDGDANHDGAFNVGESWQYTVSYTVTQDDIDNGGVVDPGLTHDNTATANTNQGVTDSVSTSVDIVQNPHITLVKAAAVADGTADEAGDVINYTIDVTNDGNMTLTGLAVSDSPADGFAAVESGGFNTGDIDQDGKLDLGETWHYTASHTVTQDEIDNGGVVDPALKYTNTASATTDQGASDPDANDSDTVSVDIVQNPHVTLHKSAAIIGGVADAAGDVIHYRIIVTNDGNMTLTGVNVTDPSVSDLAAVTSGGFNAGDTDHDGKLDLGETWQYTANHTVTQDEMDAGGSITNTASVTTTQGAADPDANDSDSASITVQQNPSVTLDKEASVPGGTADTAGEVISYTIAVHNDGNVSLTSVSVSDPSADAAPAAVTSGGFNVGDTNTDGKLSVGETWSYTASHTVTQTELNDNGGGDGFIDNTASVTTAQGASDDDSASVAVVQPPAPAALFLDKSDLVGTHFVDSDEDGHADVGTDLIQYAFQITNTGGFVLHDVTIDDPLFGGTIYGPEVLDPGESFTFTLNHFLTAADVAALHVENTATASGFDPSNNLISIMAHYDQLLPA